MSFNERVWEVQNMAFLAVIAFWGMLIQTYRRFGVKPPAVFLIFSGIGHFGFPAWGISSGLFGAYEAILVILMLLFGKVRAMRLQALRAGHG